MVILRYILALRRCIIRRIRALACLLVILTIIIMYISVSKNGLQQETKTHRRITKSTTHAKFAYGSRLNSLAITGIDLSSRKLKLLPIKYEYLLIIPHATQEILPAMKATFVGNIDKLMLEELIEFLDATLGTYHACTCQVTKPSTSEKYLRQDSCRFEKRDWTILMRRGARKQSKTLTNRVVNFFECNMFEGAFIIRRKVFEKFYFNTEYGATVLLDFFLRTEGKIKLALLTDCSLSEELHRQDRGALTSNPFYTDYIKLGSSHNIVRIIRENQMIWTKCSFNRILCPEKPLPLKALLSRQLKPMCCSQVLDMLLVDVVQAMNAIRLDYRVEYGTLLGAVRSETIIPWTRDVDIGLREEDYFKDRIFAKLKEVLSHKGYGLPIVKGQRRVVPLFPPRQSFNVSLFDKSLENQLFSERILRTMKKMTRIKTRWQDLGYLDFYIAKKERFDSLTTIKINGRGYATFANAKEVLKEWYGSEYMKGVKKKSAPVEIDIGKILKQRRKKGKKSRKKLRQRRQNRAKKKRVPMK